ncbi:MAG: tetratricopeptide repeat protein [bacterium]
MSAKRKKRIPVKKLKEDELVAATARILRFIRRQARVFAIAAIVLAVAIVLVSGGAFYKWHIDRRAAAIFYRAMTYLNSEVVPPEEKKEEKVKESGGQPENKREDESKGEGQNQSRRERTFSSQSEKYEAVREELQKILGNYPLSRYAADALYIKGNTYYNEREYDSALIAFRDYVARYPKGYFADAAHIAIGAIHENRGEYEKAIEAYGKVKPTHYLYRIALLGKGRSYESMGDNDKSQEAYLEVMAKFPTTPWAKEVEDRMQ